MQSHAADSAEKKINCRSEFTSAQASNFAAPELAFVRSKARLGFLGLPLQVGPQFRFEAATGVLLGLADCLSWAWFAASPDTGRTEAAFGAHYVKGEAGEPGGACLPSGAPGKRAGERSDCAAATGRLLLRHRDVPSGRGRATLPLAFLSGVSGPSGVVAARGDAHPSALPGGAPSPVERRNEAEMPDGDVANNASGSLTGVLITTTADMFCFVPSDCTGSLAGKARLARGSRSCWREIIEYVAQTRLAHPPPRAERVQKAAAAAIAPPPPPPGHPGSSCSLALPRPDIAAGRRRRRRFRKHAGSLRWRAINGVVTGLHYEAVSTSQSRQ